MDSVASDWFWFWLPLLVVVVVVRALAVPSSLLVSWSWLTSLSHHTIILLNHQLLLTKATKRLTKSIRLLLKDLAELKSKSYNPFITTLDLRPFRPVIG